MHANRRLSTSKAASPLAGFHAAKGGASIICIAATIVEVFGLRYRLPIHLRAILHMQVACQTLAGLYVIDSNSLGMFHR